MSVIYRKSLLETCLPLLQPHRFKSKINIQKPKAPHHEKVKYLDFTKLMLPKLNYGKKPIEVCVKDQQLWIKKENKIFQQIIAGECLRWFESSRLIAFYHMNPMSSDDQFKAYALFNKHNMLFKNYGKETLSMAIKGTPYEAALNFYVSRNVIVFSPEPDIKRLLKISKKFKQILLLAGIYEGKFVSKEELLGYSLIPDIQTARAHLVQTLNGVGSSLVQNLNAQQNILVGQLGERAKQLEES